MCMSVLSSADSGTSGLFRAWPSILEKGVRFVPGSFYFHLSYLSCLSTVLVYEAYGWIWFSWIVSIPSFPKLCDWYRCSEIPVSISSMPSLFTDRPIDLLLNSAIAGWIPEHIEIKGYEPCVQNSTLRRPNYSQIQIWTREDMGQGHMRV